MIKNVASAAHAGLDIPGTILGCGGLLLLVFGFSKAETAGWGAPITLAMLGGAALMLVLFYLWLRRAAHPLLPLRIVEDRNRGGSFLTILIAGLGIFGVFLFLTYFMQQNLGFSPIQAGLAFLPMVVCIVAASLTAQTRILPRTGPRPLVVGGMVLAALGMVYLAQLDFSSTYLPNVLPALLLLGLGFGSIFATAINTATLGVIPEDAGVASALVSTSQQVGGAAGTALLSSLAATATASFLVGESATPTLAAEAAIHGYTVAFWASAAIFVSGAIFGRVLLRGGPNLTLADSAT